MTVRLRRAPRLPYSGPGPVRCRDAIRTPENQSSCDRLTARPVSATKRGARSTNETDANRLTRLGAQTAPPLAAVSSASKDRQTEVQGSGSAESWQGRSGKQVLHTLIGNFILNGQIGY